MLPLVSVIKETANLILPNGFQIHWKHVVDDMPWYRHWDYAYLLPVSPGPTNCLEKGMLLFHQKTDKILKEQIARCHMLTYHSPHPKIIYQHTETKSRPKEGQFENEDLAENVYNPLEFPTMTPVQDEGPAIVGEATHVEVTQPAVVEEENKTMGQGDDSAGNAPSSQKKHHYNTFTSPGYRQEEIASRGEAKHVSGMPELLSRMPGMMPRATPSALPKSSLKRPLPHTPLL